MSVSHFGDRSERQKAGLKFLPKGKVLIPTIGDVQVVWEKMYRHQEDNKREGSGVRLPRRLK